MQYNPELIYAFAQRLYRRANAIIARCTLFGILGGLVFGTGGVYLLTLEMPTIDQTYSWYLAGGIALIGGLIGYRTGVERAFMLKLQAQVALCQVKIEENTRGSTLP